MLINSNAMFVRSLGPSVSFTGKISNTCPWRLIHKFEIPNHTGGHTRLLLRPGKSIIFIGANGSGKTRLGAYIERELHPTKVQRIAAQKSLLLKAGLNQLPFEKAMNGLRIGHPDISTNKEAYRWAQNPSISPLNDFDFLQQALFAEKTRRAWEYLDALKSNPVLTPPTPVLERLVKIWEDLLPHRKLEITEGAVKVLPPQGTSDDTYMGGEMSDGERVIYYLIGQCLLAPDGGVIVIDEPENHIHKAIMTKLWDLIESARPDCCFIYFTHDLFFATNSDAKEIYVLRSYDAKSSNWEIQKFQHVLDVPDSLTAEILGSRKPILFVEGQSGSLDMAIFKSIYHEFTLIPVGSCDAVIQTVKSLSRRASLHRLCVKGIIDADARDELEIENLSANGISVLGVAEIENLLLMPTVVQELAKAFHCKKPRLIQANIETAVFNLALSKIDEICSRFTIRRLDEKLKKVTMKSKDLKGIEDAYNIELASIKPAEIFSDHKAALISDISDRNLTAVLAKLDDKSSLTLLVKEFGLKSVAEFKIKLVNILSKKEIGLNLRRSIKACLPVILAGPSP